MRDTVQPTCPSQYPPQVRSTVRHKQTSTTTARADAVTPPAGLLPPSASSPKPTPFSVRALEFKTELTPTPVASLADDIAAETRDFIPADVRGYNRTGFTFREGLQGKGYYHDHVGTPTPAVQDESRDITNLNGSTLTADDVTDSDESEQAEDFPLSQAAPSTTTADAANAVSPIPSTGSGADGDAEPARRGQWSSTDETPAPDNWVTNEEGPVLEPITAPKAAAADNHPVADPAADADAADQATLSAADVADQTSADVPAPTAASSTHAEDRKKKKKKKKEEKKKKKALSALASTQPTGSPSTSVNSASDAGQADITTTTTTTAAAADKDTIVAHCSTIVERLEGYRLGVLRTVFDQLTAAPPHTSAEALPPLWRGACRRTRLLDTVWLTSPSNPYWSSSRLTRLR